MRIGLFPIHKVDSNNYSKDAKIVRDRSVIINKTFFIKNMYM